MARSYRTTPPRVTARRRGRRNPDGSLVLPKIKTRRPRPGDVHPIPAKILRDCLTKVPEEYLHGLDEIELLPRPGDIGVPWGSYLRAERKVFLYSAPMRWTFPHSFWPVGLEAKRYGASIYFDDENDDDVVITWNRRVELAVWCLFEVFFHELGHHFAWQYQPRNGRVVGAKEREKLADLHAERLGKRWHQALPRRMDAGRGDGGRGGRGAARARNPSVK